MLLKSILVALTPKLVLRTGRPQSNRWTRATAAMMQSVTMASKTDNGPEPAYSRPSGYKFFHSPDPFMTAWGKIIPNIDIAYETWGGLNKDRSNTILLQTGLSASSHAKSHPGDKRKGWWEDFIGSGRALDTDKFFVICCNNLGGCYGSTGPSSINPETGNHYALKFPFISVQDIVRSQFLVLDHLGIDRLHAVVGSSLGGMQSLASAADYSERVARMVTISAAAMSHPMSIAARYAQRRALLSDPAFNSGEYYNGPFPNTGMQLAREIAIITYRSGPEWEHRFGRRRLRNNLDSSQPTDYPMDMPELHPPSLNSEFEIEKYLEHQGRKWCEVYDPNSMLILSKAMDLFTVEALGKDGRLSLEEGLRNVTMPTLVMGAKSDILFPIWQQKQIAEALRSIGNKYVVYYELDTLYGHDTFLIDVHSVGAAVKGHLEHSADSDFSEWKE